MYPEEKTVQLKLGHTHQIDLSIEAVRRALEGKQVRGVDIAPLMGVISILEAIRDYKPNAHADGRGASPRTVRRDVGNDLEQGTHESQPDDLPLRSGAIGAGGAVDIQRTTAAPLPVSNAYALAEERSDDSQQRVVGGKVDR
jgi:hypothetical protein